MNREVHVRFYERRRVKLPPPTHLVVLVLGQRHHAQDLYREIDDVLSRVGLRLAAHKTQVVHIDEGFDFLGFHIRRHRQKGSDRRLIYTYPSKKSLTTIRRKVTEATGRDSIGFDPRVLFHRLGQITRGWALYFRHGASARAFGLLSHHLWWRTWRWLMKKHRDRNRRWIIHRYYGPGQWWPRSGGPRLYHPNTMRIERYRYRGTKIPNPWTQPTHAT